MYCGLRTEKIFSKDFIPKNKSASGLQLFFKRLWHIYGMKSKQHFDIYENMDILAAIRNNKRTL